jgi:hypothetical protein
VTAGMATRGQPTRQPDEDRCPTGLTLAGGALVVVGVAALAALLAQTPGPRLGLLTAAVLVITAVTGDARAAIGVSVMAWAVGNGFLVNRLGELSWHGRLDTWFVIGLLSAVSIGMIIADTRYSARNRRRWHPFAALLAEQTPEERPAGPVPHAEPVEEKEM